MIFIMGGPSQLGQRAIELARIASFRRILTTSALRYAPFLQGLGATHIFDRYAPDLKGQIRAVAQDDLVYAYDAVSTRDTQITAYSPLSDTRPGKLAVGLDIPEDRSGVPEKLGDTTWKFVFGDSFLWPEVAIPFWKKVGSWI